MLAEVTAKAVALPCGADLAAVVDDLEVQAGPVCGVVKFLEVGLGLADVFTFCEFPALSEAVNVGVNRESRLTEGLDLDD